MNIIMTNDTPFCTVSDDLIEQAMVYAKEAMKAQYGADNTIHIYHEKVRSFEAKSRLFYVWIKSDPGPCLRCKGSLTSSTGGVCQTCWGTGLKKLESRVIMVTIDEDEAKKACLEMDHNGDKGCANASVTYVEVVGP